MDFFVILCILFILVPLAIWGASIAPWVPTFWKDLERLKEILKSERVQEKRFLEIGSGDGRVSLFVAKHFPEMQVFGREIALPLFFVSKIRQYFSKSDNLHFALWNAFSKEDFSTYDYIYVYGLPKHLEKKLLPQFQLQAKSGAKLISYVFSYPQKYSSHVKTYGVEKENKIHVYTKD